jgi:hypothetical protein
MDDLIRAAGFRLSDIETHYMNGPRLMTGWQEPRLTKIAVARVVPSAS